MTKTQVAFAVTSILAVLCFNATSALPAWIQQSTFGIRQLWVVQAVNHEIVWASGEMGQVAVTVDGGANWLSRTVPGAIGLPTLYAFDDQVCLVADQSGRIYRTADRGITWTEVHNVPGTHFNGVHFFDDLHGWATGDPMNGAFVLVETLDGGLTWHSAPGVAPPAHAWNEQGIWRSFDWVGSQVGIFGTNKWKVWRTTNGGATWDSVTTEMQWVPGLVLNDDGRGLAGGRIEGLETPMLDYTTDLGQSWTPIFAPTLQNLQSFDWIEGTDEVWGTTIQAGIFQSTNGGFDWIRYTLGFGNAYEDLSFVDEGTGWCVGSNGPAARIWRWSGTTDVAPAPPSASLRVEVRPNPFEHDVAFVSQANGGPVEISIYDPLGRCLWHQNLGANLVGTSTLQWNGRDEAGRPLPNGVYVYRFRSGAEESTGRLIKVR